MARESKHLGMGRWTVAVLLALVVQALWSPAVLQAAAGDYVWTNLAGQPGGPGNTDGTGGEGRFDWPFGVAADSAGNLYVADSNNHTIRKVTSTGVVTTLAGSPGQTGSSDGTGSAARFNNPRSVAVDGSGNVYVVDHSNHTIRKITPAGVVTTLAGLADMYGSSDGTGSEARFRFPYGVAVTTGGVVYVADSSNHTIRKVTAAGVVTTVAGLAGSSGSTNGTGSAARFYEPTGLTVDSGSTLYVADRRNHTIRKITATGEVTTLAGLAGISGSTDGTGSAARFYYPTSISLSTTSTLYVTDSYNHTIRQVTTGGTVTTVAGLAGTSGSVDGTGSAARFYRPWGVVITSAGHIYVADTYNYTLRKMTMAGAVTTLAGSAPATGSADGTGTAALFYGPQATAVDSAGNAYVADAANHTIRKITPAGAVTTLAGLAGTSGNSDGTGSAARLNSPRGVAVDGAGNVYVADTNNHTIRRVTPTGVVTTLAGQAGSYGSSNGTGSAARFYWPRGVSVDSAGNVYVADYGNHTIRKVTSAGAVTTPAGLAGTSGSSDGTGSAARFYSPYGTDVDSAGNVYVADYGNHTIRKVTPAGAVTTLAGLAGSSGSSDGTGSAARFYNPAGVAVDIAGNLYVADKTNHTIRKVIPSGLVTTIGGTAGVIGGTDGAAGAASFCNPIGIAVDTGGILYVADSSNNRISKGIPLLSAIAVSSAGNDANDGRSWVAAKRTVQAALNAATAGGQVWVAAGTYVENITLKAGVELYGGFAGTETELAQRNWTTNVTTLDGNRADSVVTVPTNATATTRIDGFRITNGRAEYGGGLRLSSSSPTVTNNTITGNYAVTDNPDTITPLGGGLYLTYNSNPTITNNTITGNFGQGLFVTGGSDPTITNNTITNNEGTGVEVQSNSNPTITNNTITNNGAINRPGGLYVYESSPTITHNTIAGNRTTGASGGGLSLYKSSSTIANNTITGNTSVSGSGGGLRLFDCTGATVRNNIIAGNTAATVGGGLYLADFHGTIANNTIVGNTATTGGGGLYVYDCDPQIFSTIIAFNSSGILGEHYGAAGVRYCCVYGNTAYNYSGQTDYTGINGTISADPRFVQATSPYDLHLLANSPCVNTGDPAFAPAAGETDMDGQLRLAGGWVDMGADETPCTITITQQPTSQAIVVGQTAVFAVAATGSGALSCQWRKDGVDLTDDGHYQGVRTASLTISNAGFAQAGQYRCVIADAGTSAFSDSVSLVISALRVYVSPAGDNANDGLSWATAKKSVQAGLGNAAVGGQVWVAAGTYNVSPLTLKAGVALYGGFAGTETELVQRQLGACATTLRGSQITYVVTVPQGATATTRIDGFTITNGRSTNGGGVYLYHSSATIANNIITGNSAYSNGGGVYLEESSAILINNTIVGNSAPSGGGLFVENGYVGNATIVNTIVASNSSGVRVFGSTFRHNCVYGNTAYNYVGTDQTGSNGNISVDPRFVQATAPYDLHLLADSPCINAGDPGFVAGAGETDMDGQARVLGGRVDIGADESASAIIITEHPASQTVQPGQTATFRVIATGVQALAYQWRRDGQNLADGGRIGGATGAVLTIQSVSEVDAGGYDVVITDGPGSKTSDTAQLAVAARPVIVNLMGPSGGFVYEGWLVTLVCNASDGDAGDYVNGYSWSQTAGKSVALSTTNNIPANPGMSSASFVVPPLATATDGTMRFQVSVVDSHGISCVASATVTVNAYICGDISHDSYVNVGDLQMLVAAWGKGRTEAGYDPRADLNNDSYINVGDLQLLVSNWGKHL